MAAKQRFRRQLLKELDTWVADSLITSEQRQQLCQRYQLDRLKQEADGQFTSVILAIGAILVGLGAISFVAANWDRLSPSLRAIGVVVLMLGFDFCGFWLWRGAGKTKGYRRLGNAFLLIGQLMLGASIGLMAQWWQVSGSSAGLFLWWGLGVLAVAGTVRHAPSGLLAIVLVQIAQVAYYSDPLGERGLNLLLPLMPLFSLVCFLPLAYWCRSRWVFAAALLGTNTSAISAVFGEAGRVSSALEYWYWLAYVSLTSGWWAFSFIHQRTLPRIARWLPESLQSNTDTISPDASLELDFAPFARILSIFGLLAALSILSYNEAQNVWIDSGSLSALTHDLLRIPLIPTVVWGATLLSLLMWWLNLRDRQRLATAHATHVLNTVVGVTSLFVVILLHVVLPPVPISILFNLLLFVLGCTLAWSGLQEGIRWRYWMGLLAVTLQILCRFFEYDTGLLLKSAMLILCGVGTIFAGLSFERSLKHSPSTEIAPER